ncbi:hypothetical protein E3N88_25858 [Mikania micrantha]|uniref:UspA domain-containing protein n=1 Tax=Mikania micrantha TaxID=192012 RepID=A0A5N6N5X5_9ASTR|nr:hypothetical protein E3N88_25858 [Mikania micrantha]
MSPEIVEVEDQLERISRDAVDVFVAVGKHDLVVIKWAVDHVAPGARLFLHPRLQVHPRLALGTSTMVRSTTSRAATESVTEKKQQRGSDGRRGERIRRPARGDNKERRCYDLDYARRPFSANEERSQLSKEQVQIYINEENNKRRNLLQKYIRLCADAKIAVETMLIESNTTTKAILDLIQVANITNLVIGTKQTPSLRRLRKGPSKGEFIKKNAPDFCEVSVICNGKQVTIGQQLQVPGVTPSDTTPTSQNGLKVAHSQLERKFFECSCFSRKVD